MSTVMSTVRRASLATLAVAVLPLALLTASCTTARVDPPDADCQGSGPQTPRDIDDPRGDNRRIFSLAPGSTQMNLCNIHFHRSAEHRAEAFSIPAEVEEPGRHGGYRCAIGQTLSAAELAAPDVNHCRGVEPGDTIEVHWVFTSCAVEPGPTLGACLATGCDNPDLRVETQVFVVVNDRSALDFNTMAYDGNVVDGYHQPKSLPTDTGEPVQFAGSTTGPAFTDRKCSPFQVSWSVRPLCAKLDVHGLSEWCADNVFDEDHAHGVRELVTDLELLSKIAG